MMYQQIVEALQSEIVEGKAEVLQRFFKTGPGEYGEGDIFLGVTMPNQRNVAKRFYKETTFEDLDRLLSSGVHEYRMTALVIIVTKFERTRMDTEKQVLIDYYVNNRAYINNWDLVDVTCYKILGPWLYDKDRSLLHELVEEENLWSKRISIMTTMYFIKQGDYTDTMKLADILLDHPHDLIHKAVGWMLREIGNRDGAAEREFLATRYKRMPRTMLRYAIEKFPEEERRSYLHGTV